MYCARDRKIEMRQERSGSSGGFFDVAMRGV
jgi:hypothetical protein